jgi:hypothetical protein
VTDELHKRCAAQIEGLHRVIEEWLGGRVPRTRAAFAAFADAHAPDFTMVAPDGALLGTDELMPGFEGAYGTAPGLRISISEVALVHADSGAAVVTYEEWQDGPAGRTGRRSTVLLERHAAAPRGLRSRHLHETWIDHAR